MIPYHKNFVLCVYLFACIGFPSQNGSAGCLYWLSRISAWRSCAAFQSCVPVIALSISICSTQTAYTSHHGSLCATQFCSAGRESCSRRWGCDGRWDQYGDVRMEPEEGQDVGEGEAKRRVIANLLLCAFSHTGPSAWNRLPEDIHAEPDITNFWKLLKTH